MATWLQCAEYYLKVIWCRDDRRLVDAFSRHEFTCEALHDLCCRVGKEITRTDAAEVIVLCWLVLLLGWMTYIRWYVHG